MKSRWTWFLVSFLTLAGTLLYVRGRFWFIELNYDISQKQEERSSLEKERRALSVELATLQSPARIERLASKQLGLRRQDTSVPTVIVTKGTSK